MEEREAIGRLRRGEIDGLEVLVQQCSLKAVRTAYLITHDRSAAEDVVQDAFIRAYERISRFDPARPFEPWFLRIVVNGAIDAVTSRTRHEVGGDDWDDGVAFAELLAETRDGPEDALDRSELRREIEAALAHLPPRQRAAVVMRYYLDMSEGEIAEQLSIPSGTVKSRLHTARERLRGLLRPVSYREVN